MNGIVDYVAESLFAVGIVLGVAAAATSVVLIAEILFKGT
jgi:hypothetical protein